MKQSKPGITSKSINDIRIIGDNILYINGTTFAYYLLPTLNYTVASSNSIRNSINSITKLLSSLASSRPNIVYSIETLDKTITAKDIKSNLFQTIRLYRSDYDMPSEFTEKLTDDTRTYCILGVQIQPDDVGDIESYTLKDTFKYLFNKSIDKIIGSAGKQIDEERYLEIEENIYIALKSKCVRASKELTFYNYVSKLYPNYNISYDKIGFFNEDNFEDIMGNLVQTVNDNFGWFKLSNQGVDMFNFEPIPTYGAIMTYKKFPTQIDHTNFPLNYPNSSIIIKCMKKKDAKNKIKRIRGTDKFEQNQAVENGNVNEDELESTAESIALATQALNELDNGETICEFTASVLCYSQDLNDLKSRCVSIKNACQDRDILISKSLNQALDFYNLYIKKDVKGFNHLTNLRFPLSFQLNYGSIIGDAETDMTSPAIGVDIM